MIVFWLIFPNPYPPWTTLSSLIITYHHLPFTTNQCIMVIFLYIAVVTRGSWRSSSCRPIPSWRPSEMPRPSKMTTPPDLWVCSLTRQLFYNLYFVHHLLLITPFHPGTSFLITLTGEIHPYQLWCDWLHCWSQYWDLYPTCVGFSHSGKVFFVKAKRHICQGESLKDISYLVHTV